MCATRKAIAIKIQNMTEKIAGDHREMVDLRLCDRILITTLFRRTP
ncbi:hypothetical protein BAURA86_02979 [Brevibacterium aurantiacum]|uniref:Uncharacterized protein n=1 Tax=Brevibacterium aurantiacum TaxID=273384 RepID=A0A2H1KM11_BREAU|nr:hypothetical protein BAURA86_02979 [Brevibacterium aurantiacum]